MNIKYSLFLKEREFSLESKVEASTVFATVYLKKEDKSYHYPIQAKINFQEEDLTEKEAILFLLDYIDYYFDEFFKENENIFLPIDWKEVQFDNKVFLIKGQILNLKREKEADLFLKQHSEIPSSTYAK